MHTQGKMNANEVRLSNTDNPCIFDIADDVFSVCEGWKDEQVPTEDLDLLFHAANHADDIVYDILSHGRDMEKNFIINGRTYTYEQVKETLKVLL